MKLVSIDTSRDTPRTISNKIANGALLAMACSPEHRQTVVRWSNECIANSGPLISELGKVWTPLSPAEMMDWYRVALKIGGVLRATRRHYDRNVADLAKTRAA